MASRLRAATTIVVVAAVSACVALAACKQKDDAAGGSSGEGGGGGAKAATPAQVSEGEKAGAYIECSNKFVSRAYQARERYLSWVDADKGPTGKEKAVMGTYKLNGKVDTDCRAKIDKVKDAEPRMPELEAAGEALVAAIAELAPLLEEAAEYYGTSKAYKDDQLARGKELHPKLMAAFAAFEAADGQMGVQLDQLEDKALARQLEDLAKRPDKIPYLLTNVIFTGKHLVRMASSADDLDDIDLSTFEPALAQFAAAVDELRTYQKSHPNEGPSGVGGFATGAAPGVVTAANAMVRRKKAKTPFSTGDKMMIKGGNPQMVEGHPAAVVRAYNDMINASNRL